MVMFHCLNGLHSFRTKNKFKLHKKVYKNKDSCNDAMSSKGFSILEFIKVIDKVIDKVPPIIYVHLESLIKKVD